MIAEVYERTKGRIRRRVLIGPKSFDSTICDRSDLPATAPAWSSWWRSFLRGAQISAPAPSADPLTAVDFFCGCGGLAVGVREACHALGTDLDIQVAVDADSDALGVYRHNLRPHRAVCADVSGIVDFQIRGWKQEARFAYPPELVRGPLHALTSGIDLFIAGPPCEGHSNLNNWTRRADPRNLLYVEAVAAAAAMNANAVLIENVPDILSDKRGVVQTARSLLESVGYRTASATLAGDDLGLPQTRRRFFLIASKLALVSPSVVARALGGRGPSHVRWAIEDLVDRSSDHVMDGTAQQSGENQMRIEWLFENDAYDLPDHIRPRCHQNGHTYPSVYGRLRWDAPAGTISTGFMTAGRGRFIHPSRMRTLTPREAARLQGFPDWFAFRQNERDAPSRKALGKWIGDAVPPLLGYAAAFSFLSGFVLSGGEVNVT